MTSDPLEQVTQQPYAYADDSPINNTDPTGLDCGILDPGGCINDAAGAVAGVVSAGATWAWNHPVEAGGLALGVVSLGTGALAAGVIDAGATGLSTVTLGSVSAVTGVGATTIDGVYCANGEAVSCAGGALGGTGAALGIAGTLVESGVIDAAGGLATTLGRGGLIPGVIGFGVDLYGALNPSAEEGVGALLNQSLCA
jgi:hypothetical protein